MKKRFPFSLSYDIIYAESLAPQGFVLSHRRAYALRVIDALRKNALASKHFTCDIIKRHPYERSEEEHLPLRWLSHDK